MTLVETVAQRWFAILGVAAFLCGILLAAGGVDARLRLGTVSQVEASMIHSVQWANVTDTGFTVAWLTDAAIPGSGSVVYGTSPSTVFTSVNEATTPGARGDIHVVQLAHLTPSTTYYFAVQAGGSQDNNNGQYYLVTTGPTLSGQVTNRTVSGFVLLSDGSSPASGALITLKVLDNSGLNGSPSTTSATLMAVTNAGFWSIVLSPRTLDNNGWFNFTTNGSTDFIQYSVEAASLGSAGTQTVLLMLEGSGQVTVPIVVLSPSSQSSTPYHAYLPIVYSANATPGLLSPTATPIAPGHNIASLGCATAYLVQNGVPKSVPNNPDPALAIDGNAGTKWNSGTVPNSSTQVIWQWSLPGPGQAPVPGCSAPGLPNDQDQIDGFQLIPDQSPSGITDHELWLYSDTGCNVNVKTDNTAYFIWQQNTSAGQIMPLRIEPPLPVRCMIVRTISSPSVVAWEEVQIYQELSTPTSVPTLTEIPGSPTATVTPTGTATPTGTPTATLTPLPPVADHISIELPLVL